MHPSIQQVLNQFTTAFRSGSFPEIVGRYKHLAETLVEAAPNSVETTISLRLLLQSMDAACRASLDA